MKKALFSILFLCSQAFGAITYVQTSAVCCSNPNVIPNFGTATTTGNLIVVTTGILGDPSHQVTSISGGGVSTWSLAVRSHVYSDVEIWYGVVTAGTSSSSITVTYNGASSIVESWAVEYHNTSTTTPLNQTASSTSTSSPISSGSVTTTVSGELVVATAIASSNNFSGAPTNSFTRINNGTGDFIQEAYRITTTTGSYNTSWTYGSGNTDACVASFYPAGFPVVASGVSQNNIF